MLTAHSRLARQDAVQRAIAATPATESFRAREILRLHPELNHHSSILLDLAYEEYCQAADRGDTLDHKLFAAQFPEIEGSLLKLLEVHSFILANSKLAEAEPPINWPVPGDHFLGFRLNEEIGRGAFARVFLSNEVDVGNREVVVKISQRGDMEATMLGLLNHPNIVPIHSIRTDEAVSLSALCMPYLGRATATDWIRTRFKKAKPQLRKTPRHLQSVVEIGKGVCQGLQYAHDQKILHCDVKPSNILITHDCEPILLDFNLSTDQARDKYLIGGTLLYMAPEQLKRALGEETSSINESTDVFGLGATLYQMATGRSPFHLRGEPGTRLSHMIEESLDERRLFSPREKSLPDPFRSIMRKTLAFDQRDRIRSAGELFDQLTDCQEALSRPHRGWVRKTVLTSVVALGFAGGYRFLDGSTPPETPVERSAIRESSVEVEGIVRFARQAESEERYYDAIQSYRLVLKLQEAEHSDHPDPGHQFLKHSLLFCLVMNAQLQEAHDFLSEWIREISREPSGGDVRYFLLMQKQLRNKPETEQILKELSPLKRAIPQDPSNANLKSAIAVFHALLTNFSEGREHAMHRSRALQYRRMYSEAVTNPRSGAF